MGYADDYIRSLREKRSQKSGSRASDKSLQDSIDLFGGNKDTFSYDPYAAPSTFDPDLSEVVDRVETAENTAETLGIEGAGPKEGGGFLSSVVDVLDVFHAPIRATGYAIGNELVEAANNLGVTDTPLEKFDADGDGSTDDEGFNLETLSRAVPFTDDKTVSFAQGLGDADSGNYWQDVAMTGVGFGLDLATDPTTYFSGGAARAAKTAAASVGKKTAQQAAESASDDVLKQAWLRTDSGSAVRRQAADSAPDAASAQKNIDDLFNKNRDELRGVGAQQIGLETQSKMYSRGFGAARRQLDEVTGDTIFSNNLIKNLSEDELGGFGLRVPLAVRMMSKGDRQKVVRSGLWKKGGVGDGTGRAYDSIPGLANALESAVALRRSARGLVPDVIGGNLGGTGQDAFQQYVKALRNNDESAALTQLSMYNVARESKDFVAPGLEGDAIISADNFLRSATANLSENEDVAYRRFFESQGNPGLPPLTAKDFADLNLSPEQLARAEGAAKVARRQMQDIANAGNEAGIKINGNEIRGDYTNQVPTPEFQAYAKSKTVKDAGKDAQSGGGDITDIRTGIGSSRVGARGKSIRQLNEEFRAETGSNFDKFESDPAKIIQNFRAQVRSNAALANLEKGLVARGLLIDGVNTGASRVQQSSFNDVIAAVDEIPLLADALDLTAENAALRAVSARTIRAAVDASEDGGEKVLEAANALLSRSGDYDRILRDLDRRIADSVSYVDPENTAVVELEAIKELIEAAQVSRVRNFSELPVLSDDAIEALEAASTASARALEVLNDDTNLTRILEIAKSDPTGKNYADILETANALTDEAMETLRLSMPSPDATDLTAIRRLEQEVYTDVFDADEAVKEALGGIKIGRGTTSNPVGGPLDGTGIGDGFSRIGATNDATQLAFLNEKWARSIVVDALGNMHKALRKKDLGTFEQSYDAWVGSFKKWATIGRGPGFWARNFSGAQWNAWLVGVTKVDQEAGKKIATAVREARKKSTEAAVSVSKKGGKVADPEMLDIFDKELQRSLKGQFVDGLDMDLYEIWKAADAQKLGAGSRTSVAADALALDGDKKRIFGNSNPDSVTNKILNKTTRRVADKVDNTWIQFNADISQDIENQIRTATFISGLKKHGTSDVGQWAAGNTVKMSQFDYDDLSPKERMLAKTGKGGALGAMPFFVWQRNNVPLQIRAVMNEPGRVAAALEAHEASKVAFQDELQENLERYLPQWMKDRGGFLVPGLGDAPLVVGLNLPLQDLSLIPDPDDMSVDNLVELGSKFAQDDIMGGANPGAKFVVETLTGRDSFTGADFDRPMQEVSPYWRLFDLMPGIDTYTDSSGKTYVNNSRVIRSIKNALPPLAQAERIAPFGPLESEKYQERLLTSVLSQTVGGVAPITPIATATADQLEGASRRYEQEIRNEIKIEAAKRGLSASRLSKWLRQNPGLTPDLDWPGFRPQPGDDDYVG